MICKLVVVTFWLIMTVVSCFYMFMSSLLKITYTALLEILQYLDPKFETVYAVCRIGSIIIFFCYNTIIQCHDTDKKLYMRHIYEQYA